MESFTVTRDTKLKDVLRSPAGHDILAKALYSAGLDLSVITKTPLGSLKISALQKLTAGKIDDKFIDSLLGILNSEKDAPLEDISLTFNKQESFGYIGRDSDIQSLDVQKAVSDMRKDSVLQQYQYFVGSARNLMARSADGAVVAKF